MTPRLEIMSFKKLIVLSVLIVFSCSLAGQAQTTSVAAIDPPIVEKFTMTDGLVIPSRSKALICSGSFTNERPSSECTVLGPQEWRSKHILTVYDVDGNPWNTFSVDPRDSAYFMNARPQVIKPLGPDGAHPDLVVLRLVRESSNWLEVEIDEQTHEVKYVYKRDPLWFRTDWTGIFNISVNILVDQSAVKLRETPGGKEISDYPSEKFIGFKFVKLEGDWMFVKALLADSSIRYGWIRWQGGRKILIGSFLSDWKIPGAGSLGP